MTPEEYEKKYLTCVKALGISLAKEVDKCNLEASDKRAITPVHVGVQVAMSEISALADLLIEKNVMTRDEYRESVLAQLMLQREVVEARSKDP